MILFIRFKRYLFLYFKLLYLQFFSKTRKGTFPKTTYNFPPLGTPLPVCLSVALVSNPLLHVR